MVVNTVTEAKAQSSALLERVSRGEEVIINQAVKPVAILKPYRAENRPRRPGRLRGKIRSHKDFDQLPADIAEALGAPGK